MTENRETIEGQNQIEWMRRVEESNELQAVYAKKQYTLAKIRTICTTFMLLIVIVCVLILAPRLHHTFEEIDFVMNEMETVMLNLEEASTALAKTDLAGMLDGVNTLVQDSQTGVEEAVEKISALDIESLNEAIRDLKAVVAPLAKLFGR